MLALSLLGLSLVAGAGDAAAESKVEADKCRVNVALGSRGRVYNVRFVACPSELHSDVEFRVRQVPWDMVLASTLSALETTDTEDWTIQLQLKIPEDKPANRLPTHDVPPPADPLTTPLSDRFVAPAADRRVQLLVASATPPPDVVELALVALLGDPSVAGSSDDSVTLYSRGWSIRQQQRKGRNMLATCVPWLVFDAAGKPIDLATHPERACKLLPNQFLEPLLWRWSPPRWDGQPVRAGIPVRQTAIGEFSVARGQRFAPFYAGDTLVNDVPYALGVPMGGRPTLQRYPAMEIPMVFPELLEAKLGIEDASRIRCTAHLWAAPQRELPYAVSVRDCPEFFRSVVSQAYEDARVESPDTPTHYVESVVFSFDEAKETWDIRRE